MTTPAAPYRDPARSLLAIPLLLSVLAAGCDRGGAPETPVVDASALDANHRRAAGLLARYEYADAVDLLEQVVADDPDRLDARVAAGPAALRGLAAAEHLVVGAVVAHRVAEDDRRPGSLGQLGEGRHQGEQVPRLEGDVVAPGQVAHRLGELHAKAPGRAAR